MSRHSIELSLKLRPATNKNSSVFKITDSNAILIGDKKFNYLSYILQGSDQSQAYRALGERLVNALREGYNCSLLAYGQTGSGKTYSMLGPPGSLTESALSQSCDGVPEDWGVLPRIMLHILRDGSFGKMHASAIEVYLDVAYDLLDDRKPLRVGGTRSNAPPSQYMEKQKDGSIKMERAHPSSCDCFKCFQKQSQASSRSKTAQNSSTPASGDKDSSHYDKFSTSGETRWAMNKPEDVARLSRTIEITRTAQGHLLNARSSRSHCLVSLYLTSKSKATVTETQFLFVDLAGSERIEKSGVTGDRATEATCINSSLTTLGRVIKALGTPGTTKSHIPYRDSTLTMLLSSAFGGKSCTSVVINASSDEEHVNETISSLHFGERLVKVKNKATVVTSSDLNYETQLLKIQIKELKEELALLERNGRGAHFGSTVPITEQRSFNENRFKYEKLYNESCAIQTEIAELLSKGMEKKGSRHLALIAKYEQTKFNADNIRDIIERQKTIPDFWYAPTPWFNKKSSELKELETRLGQLH